MKKAAVHDPEGNADIVTSVHPMLLRSSLHATQAPVWGSDMRLGFSIARLSSVGYKGLNSEAKTFTEDLYMGKFEVSLLELCRTMTRTSTSGKSVIILTTLKNSFSLDGNSCHCSMHSDSIPYILTPSNLVTTEWSSCKKETGKEDNASEGPLTEFERCTKELLDMNMECLKVDLSKQRTEVKLLKCPELVA
ncbi:hypothetical protein AAES_87429 [Amazona aestiva]|uniref:Uncharacterized protein n=1 Tax=Amazona aestiva TaxID=12930 RepID=A0A0Q3Q7U5_AMAAE|nr:hypothetical protein AAES_87429 [Amazona aestiva]